MTRGVKGHSPANVMKHLKGLDFPADKSKILAHAGRLQDPIPERYSITWVESGTANINPRRRSWWKSAGWNEPRGGRRIFTNMKFIPGSSTS